jgi:hypothetical protein
MLITATKIVGMVGRIMAIKVTTLSAHTEGTSDTRVCLFSRESLTLKVGFFGAHLFRKNLAFFALVYKKNPMTDGPPPPQVTPAKSQLQTPPSGAPVAGQVPPTQAPMVSLAPPPGGGNKTWIIIVGLAVLLGLAMWGLMEMTKEDEFEEEPIEEVVTVVPKKRAKKREAAETAERPLKKEMAELSSKNRSKFEENVGKWVLMIGEVRSGNAEGVLEFKSPAGVTGQLVKGSAEHITGNHVKVIGWLLTEKTIQIDGVFDVTFVDPVDLLPKKDVYTSADGEQLVSLRNTKATFQGKVKQVRISEDMKNIYVIFEGESHEFYGSGKIDKLKKDEVTEESLKELVGKTVKLKGKLGYSKKDESERIYINFDKKENYEVVEE